MLTARDAKGDLAKLTEELKDRPAKVEDCLKVLGLVIKILLGMRGNQVKIMKKLEIPLNEPRTRDEKPKTTDDSSKDTEK